MENKKRLIYAEDAKRAIEHYDPAFSYYIDNVPTVDAVQVVRCKDCKHYEKKWSYYKTSSSEDVGCGYCWHWEYETGMSPNQVDGDDFCSYGERKDNG